MAQSIATRGTRWLAVLVFAVWGLLTIGGIVVLAETMRPTHVSVWLRDEAPA